MKRNKLSILAIVALGGLMACGPIASAQDATPPAKPTTPPADGTTPPPRRGRGPNIQAILDKLDLTADQKDKAAPVVKEFNDKMAALRADSSLAQEDRRPKMKEIRDAFTAKMKTILTPEQFTKFEELSKQGMRPPGAPGAPSAVPTAPKGESTGQN
jgi:protein CpxP